MIERFGKVSNPLTIVAVFAAIVEVSGSVTLPFLSAENQFLYMLFLILFPFTLLLLFFGVLIFKNDALYAPSDWKDEANFFRGRTIAKDKTLSAGETIELDDDALIEHLLEPTAREAAEQRRALAIVEERFGPLRQFQVSSTEVGRKPDGVIRYRGRDYLLEMKHVAMPDDVYRLAGFAATQYLDYVKNLKLDQKETLGLLLVFVGDFFGEQTNEYYQRLLGLLKQSGIQHSLLSFVNPKA